MTGVQTCALPISGSPDFSYAVSARLIAAPRPEGLPELFSRWGVDDDGKLSAWLASEMDLAATDLKAAMQAAAAASADGSVDEAALAGLVASRHPLLDVRAVQAVSSRMPDMRLYEQARSLYASYMERFRASVEPALAAASAQAAGDQVRIDALKRYGELLSAYPALIDYLAIQAGLAPRQSSGK